MVETRIGGPERGGAVLTGLGRELVETFEAIHAQAEQAAGTRLRELLCLMPEAADAQDPDDAQSVEVEKP